MYMYVSCRRVDWTAGLLFGAVSYLIMSMAMSIGPVEMVDCGANVLCMLETARRVCHENNTQRMEAFCIFEVRTAYWTKCV